MAVNEALIKGAAIAAGGFNDLGAAFNKGFQPVFNSIQLAKEKEALKQEKADLKRERSLGKIDGKVASYMSKLNSNVDMSKLTAQEQKVIAEKSFEWKTEYAGYANELANVSPSTDPQLYMEISDKMNNVNQRFTNLVNNVKTAKQGKIDYLNAQELGTISAGNDLTSQEMLSTIYTDNAAISITDNGSVAYEVTPGNVMLVDDLPVLFSNEAGRTIGKQIGDVANAIEAKGLKLTDNDIEKYSNQIGASLQNRNTLLSIVRDNSAIPGVQAGVFDDIPGYLYDPQNTDILRDVVVQKLVEGLAASAEAGVAALEQKNQTALEVAAKSQQQRINIANANKPADPEDVLLKIEAIENEDGSISYRAHYKNAKRKDQIITKVSDAAEYQKYKNSQLTIQ